uniref:Putative secreted protein n=1 Tax=Anopheles darlingi TaxID=43151 RepID=A0A2M4DNT1_ANODA
MKHDMSLLLLLLLLPVYDTIYDPAASLVRRPENVNNLWRARQKLRGRGVGRVKTPFCGTDLPSGGT